MRTYAFKVLLEEDAFDDGRQAYHASCPALKGCHTWGYTQEEALANIQEAAELYIEDLMDHDEPIPMEMVSSDLTVSLTLPIGHYRDDVHHEIFFNRNDGRRIVIPVQDLDQTFPPKTIAAIIKDADWTTKDLKRLKLI